ncbi:MAG TPA: hypothetical protein VGG85_00790 [Terracidiphilus sp.]|jgi:hypothetical protein
MANRDNFTNWQRDVTFAVSAREVRLRWREDFRNRAGDYYMCAHCRFVSDNRAYFEVDHLVSCEHGGNANRETLQKIADLQAQLERPLDRQDLGVLVSANLNDQLLCHGCNQGKKSKGMRPDDVPAGCGFAYRRHEEDLNPDHIHNGVPTPIGYVHPRYRQPL